MQGYVYINQHEACLHWHTHTYSSAPIHPPSLSLSLSVEALEFLRGAVDAVAEMDPQVAAAGHWGKVGLLNAWHTRLSVALQKGNAACLLQAGRVRNSADFCGDTGWEEDIEDLLREAAAAAAGVGGLES